MPVLKFDEIAYEEVKQNVQRKLIHNENLMSVLIDFSGGPWEEADPPHAHPHEQVTYIADGELIFSCEGEEDQKLKKGDFFSVPSGKNHTIKLLSKTARLIDSFYPLREDFLK